MTTTSQAYRIDPSNPGSDLAGESTATMAASSLAFRHNNPSYANELLTHAQQTGVGNGEYGCRSCFQGNGSPTVKLDDRSIEFLIERRREREKERGSREEKKKPLPSMVTSAYIVHSGTYLDAPTVISINGGSSPNPYSCRAVGYPSCCRESPRPGFRLSDVPMLFKFHFAVCHPLGFLSTYVSRPNSGATAGVLFKFADKYRGKYDSSITVDTLMSCCGLQHGCTRPPTMSYLGENGDALGGTGWAMTEFGWDVKYSGVQTLVAKVIFEAWFFQFCGELFDSLDMACSSSNSKNGNGDFLLNKAPTVLG
ncbi:glycosyl hydrolase 9C3 [Actinidia rufa]|uniref:cellulase n=1 Tax=Actinidia rufa TaxID=165716 RepID=A0A7J0FD36_9ERIC|nr:glycosyl hydrolase 9C3 [Actinidia rufa]